VAQQPVTPPPTKFTPVNILLRTAPTASSTVEMSAEFDAQFNAVRRLNAQTRFRVSDYLDVSGGWSRQLLIEGLPGFDNPDLANQTLSSTANLRSAANKYGGTYSFNYDVMRRGFVNQSVLAYYNAQCCGVVVEYGDNKIPSYGGVQGRVQNRYFNLSFTLAGIGTFSDFLGAFGADPYRR
jgi:hypothetical protein